MDMKRKLFAVLMSFALVLSFMPFTAFADDDDSGYYVPFKYLGTGSARLWSTGIAEYTILNIPDDSRVEITAGTRKSNGSFDILFTQGNEYTYDRSSNVLTLYGDAVSKTCKDDRTIRIQAVVYDSAGKFYGQSYEVLSLSVPSYSFSTNMELNTGYTQVYNSYLDFFQLYDTGYVEICNEKHPLQSEIRYTISDVTILSQTPESGTGDVITLEHRGGTQPYWRVDGRRLGSAVVHVSLDDADGKHSEIDITIDVVSDTYNVYISDPNNFTDDPVGYLPGESMELLATGKHMKRVNADTIEEVDGGYTIEWEIPDDEKRISLVENPEDPKRVRVDIESNIDVYDEPGPVVKANLYDDNGKLQSTAEFYILLDTESFRIFIDPVDPKLEIGASAIIKPEVRRYYLDSNNTIKYEIVPDVGLSTPEYWGHESYNRSILSIEETGNENEIRITRTDIDSDTYWFGVWYTYEDNRYSASIDLVFKDLNHVLSFNECENNESIKVANNGDLELTLNKEDLSKIDPDALVFDFSFTDEDRITDDMYTVEGDKITLHGKVIERNGPDYLWVQAKALYNNGDQRKYLAEANIKVILEMVHKHRRVLVPYKAATCNEPGYKGHYECSECGLMFDRKDNSITLREEDVLIPALGHDWDEGVITKHASADTEGEITYTCRRDETHTKIERIPVLTPETAVNTDAENLIRIAEDAENVLDGDSVSEGDFAAASEKAEAAVEEANAAVTNAETLLNNARASLNEAQASGDADAINNAKAALNTAKQAVADANLTLAKAKAGVSRVAAKSASYTAAAAKAAVSKTAAGTQANVDAANTAKEAADKAVEATEKALADAETLIKAVQTAADDTELADAQKALSKVQTDLKNARTAAAAANDVLKKAVADKQAADEQAGGNQGENNQGADTPTNDSQSSGGQGAEISAKDNQGGNTQATDTQPAEQTKVVKTIIVNKATVSAAVLNSAVKSAGSSPESVTRIVLGRNVKKIKNDSFKKFKKVTLLEIQTRKLTAKSVKGALRGSKVKTVKISIGSKKVNNQYIKKYKKLFTKKIVGKKVIIK